MVQEYIEIRGARENNLKDVELRLPKRKITIFTGVSGSGKSSVVFDTIANEAQRLLFENDKKIADYTPEELDLLLYSEPRKHTGLAYNTYEGLVYKFNRKFVARDIQTLSSRIRQKVEPFLKLGPCPLCKGARLNQAALSCRINGYNIADLSAMEVDELVEVVKGITEPAAAPLVRTLTERLQHLVDIGLEYLSLERTTD